MDLKIIIRSQDKLAEKKTVKEVMTALNEAGVGYEGPFISEPSPVEAIQLKYENWYKHPVPVVVKTYERSFITRMTQQGLARLNQIMIPDTVEITFQTITEENKDGS